MYLLWSVESTIRATQPFDLCLTDTPELVTEGIRQYEVAAYRKSGQTAFTVAGSIPDEHDLTAPGGEVIRTDYVVTRHSITHLPANWSDYEVKNSVTVTVTPVDHADPVTSCSDTESFAEQKIHYGGRPGDINAGKQGMTTSYELSKLTDYPNTSVSGLRYKAYVEGNTWYYTYQNEQGTTDGREDGYSDANRSFYGKVPVTFTIQENSQPNLLAGTAERHNLRVWYKGTQDTVYHYSDWLSPGDYQIDRVDYSYIFRDAEYDVAEHNFKQTANLTLEQIHEIQETATDRIGDLVFTLEKNGVLLDGELHYSFSSQSYDAVGTDANAILACISNESSGSALVFAPDAHITGYTLSNTNAMYYTRLYSEPSFSLLWNTGNSSVLRPILLSLGEKPTLNLWNTAILKVTQDDDLQNYYTRQHYDTVLGDFKESRLTKGWIARQNDALRRMYTVTWNVKMEETYTVDDETRYISQEGGCFYDLLPQGTEYQSEYIATYTITHGDANAAPDEENSNTAVRTALTTGRNTVYEKDETEVTFTNREPSFSLRIGKQNAQEAYLPGAVLTLYRAELELPVDDDAEEQHLQAEILRSTSDPVVISTGSYAQSMNLTAGSYILRETAAPDGYRKADDIRIEASKDGLVAAWSVTREETAEGTLLREIQKTRMSGYSWQIGIDMVDQTECSLQKRWTDMSGQDTLPWPTGESIRLTVYTGASGPETQVVMMEIPEPETGETWSFPMGVDGKIQVYCEDARETGTDYQFRIVGLPPLEEDRNYYFIEDSVEGYLTPVYTMPDALETLQYAVSGGTIVNRQQSAVELPATGGRGKGLYYILGAGMLLCSGVLLWRRRA